MHLDHGVFGLGVPVETVGGLYTEDIDISLLSSMIGIY